MLQAGNLQTMKVERKAPFGYFLSDGQTEILLHNNEANGTISEGDSVQVFLYIDHQGRLAATMQQPHIVLGEFGWLTVKDVNRRMGVFLDLGIHKELLLSKDDLPQEWSSWPEIGDRVFVGLKHDKKGRLLARLGIGKELEEQAVKGTSNLVNQEVSGHIYRVINVGAFLFTTEGYIGFLHRDERTQPIRLGELITARVKSVRDDGHLNVTQMVSKKVGYEEDSQKILQLLQDRGGAMPYTDETEPDIIRTKFNISKGAFKRALGKLMKEDLVYQEEGWTYLKTRG
ncbi:CvfB family protein [Ammoniphilus resinae]|uniref:RNA-binding protein (Virulence factor B family) n=1 Tax=Ammoniphilus resinae TaxID=861532 RepID=A0ABS4GWF0_9BACL|nr:S1-like domain-containing RNA-binding protein [Ammoniphilus resinae]MBP1934592.1 putative RNA-binding protein (virulence factor B family) [Ammoniphilus resinae]